MASGRIFGDVAVEKNWKTIAETAKYKANLGNNGRK